MKIGLTRTIKFFDGSGADHWTRVLVYYGVLLVVLLAALWPFRGILGYYFTKGDTGATLLSARIRALEDVVRILTRPFSYLMNPASLFYRPVTTLSFSLDYAVWGLSPVGYHLTDLLLHVAVAGLLFRVVYLFNGREVGSGALAGLTYTLHPLLVDVVPANNHRQEMLTAVFLLAGLWAFQRCEYRKGDWSTRGVALACFVFSVAAKEVGILFLPLVMTHLWLIPPEAIRDRWDRLVMTLKRSLPYGITAGVYVIWWVYVTRARAFLDASGSFRPRLIRGSWWQTVHQQLIVFPREYVPFYFRAVLHPFLKGYTWVASWLPSPDGLAVNVSTSTQITSGVGVVLVGLVIIRFVRRADVVSFRDRIAVLGRITAGLAALGVVGFPLYAEGIDWMIGRAYRGESFGWLASMMDSRDHFSAADYARKARFGVLAVLMGVLIAGGGLEAVLRPGGLRRSLNRVRGWLVTSLRHIESVVGSLNGIVFYLVWLILPSLFYSVTRVQEFNNMYIGLLPLAALFGTLGWGGVSTLGIVVYEDQASDAIPTRWEALIAGVLLLLVGWHGIRLVEVSPLVKDYPAWDRRQAYTRLYHGMLFRQVATLPRESTIRLHGVVRWVGKEAVFPHFRTAPILNPRPWLDLRFPNKKFVLKDWVIRNIPADCSCSWWLEKQRLGSHDFQIITHVAPDSQVPLARN